MPSWITATRHCLTTSSRRRSEHTRSSTLTAQLPHTSLTRAELRVRSLCTRAARGCPAGLPGRAKGAANTVPDLTPPSRNIRGGEVRNSSKARPVSPAGQNQNQGQRQGQTRIVGLRPPSATLRAAHESTDGDGAQEEKQTAGR
jgi:hypothetical protein